MKIIFSVFPLRFRHFRCCNGEREISGKFGGNIFQLATSVLNLGGPAAPAVVPAAQIDRDIF